MTILHNSSQDEMIPGRAGTVVAQRRRSTPLTAALGGGIAGGTTMTTMPALALASASASAPTAAATMAIARCPFDQEVEYRGAEQQQREGGSLTGRCRRRRRRRRRRHRHRCWRWPRQWQRRWQLRVVPLPKRWRIAVPSHVSRQRAACCGTITNDNNVVSSDESVWMMTNDDTVVDSNGFVC